MKVFVTGASGFIGSHLIRGLIDAGHEILALATPESDLRRIKDCLHHVSILRGRLEEIIDISNKLSRWRPQACVHLAWYAEPGEYLRSKNNLTALQGSLALLQILSECGCEQFVGAGTCAEYATKADRLAETDRIEPATLYAATKSSLQLIGGPLAAQIGLRFAWGRIFYLYGPQEDTRRLIPSTILSLQRGESFYASPGAQVRDYLHVTDVARAFTALLEERASGVYNICSSETVTIRHILDSIGRQMERPELIRHGALPYRDWDPMFVCGDNRKLASLGWQPQVGLQEGLKDTIAWLRNA